ncbi:hypothetical protein BpHYR1_029842 [Brachionus plicatilis]|uniref:Uncharacterized protein n=1 Tax=Brachionus plicatilis TaxID=10195 RepID=A0A3M7PYM1_BRAPC|nr:hypothetical protein BpHYR1_029842 [Brachionus plicatilis]
MLTRRTNAWPLLWAPPPVASVTNLMPLCSICTPCRNARTSLYEQLAAKSTGLGWESVRRILSSGLAVDPAVVTGVCSCWRWLRAAVITLCISFLLERKSFILALQSRLPSRAMASRASSSHWNAMNASPRSPPMMCTPPSGITRPSKNLRMSTERASSGRCCRRIITGPDIVSHSLFFCFFFCCFSFLVFLYEQLTQIQHAAQSRSQFFFKLKHDQFSESLVSERSWMSERKRERGLAGEWVDK